MPRPLRRAMRLAAGTALLLGIAARGPAPFAQSESTTLWTYPVPGQGEVQMELPSSWKEVARDEKDGIVRFRPRDGVKAELTLVVSWAETPDPDFNGPSRLKSLVEAGARDFLDQAVEARYTIRELQGPQSAGYYWALRDRAPRKEWARYLTRGLVGAGTALLDFTLVTTRPETPEIRQALKMLGGARQAAPGEEPPARR